MRLEGIHHVTCITGDAPGNVDFYTRVLGLRMVKKTVNQDDPTVYHLFYADEEGSPGADITFFEYPGARRGRPGDGMVHTITFRVGSDESLDFWEARLGAEGIATRRAEGRLGFDDPEGLGLELAVVSTTDAPLAARHPEIPAEHALQGFDGVRAFAADPEASRALLEDDARLRAARRARPGRCAERSGAATTPTIRRPLPEPGSPGPERCTTSRSPRTPTSRTHGSRRSRAEAGARRGVIDRFWFRSIYFREPSGVLFEIATLGPGFTIDEEADHLGEALILPPAFEHLRGPDRAVLTPLPDPRADVGGIVTAELHRLDRPSAGTPEGALVLLHGRGADEHDLFRLLDVLDPERRLLGITPRGPLSLPPGGAHWYRLGGIPTPDPETFSRRSRPRQHFSTAAGAARSHRARRVLAGRRDDLGLGLGAGRPRPAAIIALSGFMPEVRGLRARPRRPRGVPDRRRARIARSGDPGRVRPGQRRSACAAREPTSVAGDAGAAHDRPARGPSCVACRPCRRAAAVGPRCRLEGHGSSPSRGWPSFTRISVARWPRTSCGAWRTSKGSRCRSRTTGSSRSSSPCPTRAASRTSTRSMRSTTGRS